MEDDESLMDTVKTLFYAIVIAILIRTFLFEPFKIPSGSMYPTLYVGDYLFVSKYTYGYSKHSLPFSMPLFEGRIWADEPNRGDVVVFKFPQDNKTDYIKRIIGLPGDKVKLEDGRLYVNGELVNREEIEDLSFETVRAMPSVITSISKRCRMTLSIKFWRFPTAKAKIICQS